MSGNGETPATGFLPTARIVLDLQPGRTAGEYGVNLRYEGVEGGWPTVFGLLLAALGIAVNQMTPGQSVGNSPVFQAMCNVFRVFLKGLVQATGAGPRVERVAQMPSGLPDVEKLIH